MADEVPHTPDDEAETVWPGPNPTQDDLLQLARKGREAWNRWRDAHPEVRVDFSGVDFTTPRNARIDFTGFEFGDFVRFDGAMFGESVQFRGASFGVAARFDGATIGEAGRFHGPTFGDLGQFEGAIFGYGARFDGAIFSYSAGFQGTTFAGWASFEGATFGDSARFDGATFGDQATFDSAIFYGGARFDGWSNGQLASLENRIANELPEEARDRYLEARRSGPRAPHSLGSMDFARAQFKGRASFTNREFLSDAVFAHARFDQPPDFTGTDGWEKLDWTNTEFSFAGSVRGCRTPNWTTETETAARLRRLRKIAGDIRAHDAERDLFILERKAERGVLWCDWWRRKWDLGRLVRAFGATGLLFFYSLFSDCGRSIWRPGAWLAAVNFSAYFAFKDLAKAENSDSLLSFTIANLVPFFGVSRTGANEAAKTLFGASVLPKAVQFLALGQGILNVLLIFLLLLALRNHFRVR